MFSAADPQGLHHGAEWQHVHDVRHPHEQAADDGEGQREPEGELRALDRRSVSTIDESAELLEVGAHDVHPDAAPGHLGHLGGGREAAGEDEVERVALATSVPPPRSETMPLAIAFALSRSASMPRPSSSISMTMWFS